MTGTASNGEASEEAASSGHGVRRPGFLVLTVGSIGVVYGDIGTSPLYAFREAVAAAMRWQPASPWKAPSRTSSR